MTIADHLRSYYAVRQFKPEPVPEDVILNIIDTARRAQSSKNTQPWAFLVVRDRDMLKKLSTLGDFAGHVAGAAFAVALVGEQKGTWNSFDLGQAAALIQLVARDYGVGSCIAAMFQVEEARALLGIPPEKNFFTLISFGYPAEDARPAKLGGRKPVQELVMWERWQDRTS